MGVRVGVAVVLAAVLAACSSSSSATSVSTTTTQPPVVSAPRETTFTVDGRAVTMVCKGRGRIPVVFQAGGTDPGTVWDPLVKALGPEVLTCVFDRPGVAASRPSPGLTTPAAVAKTLAAVLALAHVGPRVVLVGHSIGAADALEFGNVYPDQVAGAVLFDPTTPSAILDPSSRPEFVRIGFEPDPSAAQLLAVFHWPAVPLRVLAHDPEKAVREHTFGSQQQLAWSVAEQRYARLSPLGTYRTVPGTNHYVFVGAPAVAVAAVRDTLTAAARG